MITIIKQAFAPLKNGTCRVLFKSMKGNVTAIEITNDDIENVTIIEMFNRNNIFQKIGGQKSAANRKAKQ
jgi:hypothetical protein